LRVGFRAGLAALVIVGLGTRGARADDTTDLQTLLEEPVVRTASKTLETASSSPATSTILSADDMRRLGIRTLDEAINFLSLGMTVEGSVQTMEIGARGVLFDRDYGNHVLLLLDGHALNEQWGGAAYFERGMGVPLEIIDHVEVILGPGSVLYGSNAMLGVINIVTRRARDWRGLHAVVEGEIATTIRAAAGFGHELKLFGQRAELTAEVEYFARKGPAFTYGSQHYGDDSVTGAPKRFIVGAPGTGYWGGLGNDGTYAQVPGGYARLVIGDFEINLRGSLWKRQNSYAVWAFDNPEAYELDRWVSLDLRHRAQLSTRAELSSRLYGDAYDYHQVIDVLGAEDCLSGQLQGCHFELAGSSRWVGLEEQLSLDWLKDGTLTTLVGADLRLKHTASRTDISDIVTGDNPGPSGVFGGLEKAAALYLEQKARLLRRLDLSAGGRFDLDERFGSRLSPRAAAALRPWDGGTVKISYAEAFRAPTAYERYYVDPTYQVPASDLRPEVVRSLEASVEQRFKAQRVHVGVFRSWFRDIVASQTLTPVEIAQAVKDGLLEHDVDYARQYRNIASADSYGFNLAVEGAAVSGRLRYGLNFTGALARQSATEGAPGTEMQAAAQAFGNARVTYSLGGDLPTFGVAGRYAGRRLASGATDSAFAPVPYAPPLGELRATVSGAVPRVKGLSYRLSANYSFTERAPFTVGPGSSDNTRAELAPYDRFRTAIALYYDLAP
jgi:outer membrane cobalamin receptor